MKWETAKLGEVGRFIRGITFKPDDIVEQSAKDAVVCMRTKNVQKELDQDDIIAVPSEFVRREEQYLQQGDMLVSTANSWELVGKTCWVPQLSYPATAGGFISILRADQKWILPRYLYHWVTYPKTQTKLRHCGRQTTNISNMSLPLAEELEIPFPPLAEQRRLAAILDEADALRKVRAESLRLLDQLVKATFLDIFGDPVLNPKGWEEMKLGLLTTKIGSGSTPRGGESAYVAEGIRFIRSQNVRMNHMDLDGISYIDNETHERMKGTWIKQYDVLLNITGASIGRVAYYPGEDDTANVNQHVCIVRPQKDKLSYCYLSHCISQDNYQKKMMITNQGGTREAFNFEKISNFVLPVPPFPLQRRFSDFVTEVERERESMLSALAASEQLFASPSQRAFRGEL